MGNKNQFSERMRNIHFKSKIFVLVAILLAGLFAFSYWGMSTQNNDFMTKIEALETSVKIGTRKQKDLEDDLEGMVKKNNDLQRVNAKLKSDLMQKETLINAQGEEATQWRDKVRVAESELEKFKTSVNDKVKELATLKKQIEANAQDLSSKDLKLSEAQEAIKKLQSLLETRGLKNEAISQVPNTKNQTINTSSPHPEADQQSSNVLAKPSNKEEKHDDDDHHKDDDNEVPNKRSNGEEEMELLAPEEKNGDVLEEPDEAKFREIQAEMADDQVAKVDASKEVPNAGGEEDGGINVANEPNLINSQGENLDDEAEPALVDVNPPLKRQLVNNQSRFHNFNPRDMGPDGAAINDDDDHIPEDQEIENEHEDDERIENNNAH